MSGEQSKVKLMEHQVRGVKNGFNVMDSKVMMPENEAILVGNEVSVMKVKL